MRTQPRKDWAVYLLVALTGSVAGTIPAYGADQSAAGTDARPPVKSEHPNSRTRDPATSIAKRLDLDAKQTAQARRLLIIRQARIRAIWTDDAIAPDDRVGAVKAINETTEAQIRALLSDEQKKKYFQPRPNAGPTTDPQPSVADWMNVNRPRKDSSPAPTPDPAPK
jgi:hypothetical protein